MGVGAGFAAGVVDGVFTVVLTGGARTVFLPDALADVTGSGISHTKTVDGVVAVAVLVATGSGAGSGSTGGGAGGGGG